MVPYLQPNIFSGVLKLIFTSLYMYCSSILSTFKYFYKKEKKLIENHLYEAVLNGETEKKNSEVYIETVTLQKLSQTQSRDVKRDYLDISREDSSLC